MQERIRALEIENKRVHDLLAEREQGFVAAACQFQHTAHEARDSLNAQMAQQSAVANARLASAETAIHSQRQEAAEQVGSVRAQARVQMEALQLQHSQEKSQIESNVAQLQNELAMKYQQEIGAIEERYEQASQTALDLSTQVLNNEARFQARLQAQTDNENRLTLELQQVREQLSHNL